MFLKLFLKRSHWFVEHRHRAEDSEAAAAKAAQWFESGTWVVSILFIVSGLSEQALLSVEGAPEVTFAT